MDSPILRIAADSNEFLRMSGHEKARLLDKTRICHDVYAFLIHPHGFRIQGA